MTTLNLWVRFIEKDKWRTMRKEYRNLGLFILIAFLLPLAALVAQTMISNDFIRFILYGIQAAAPTISAIVVLCLSKKLKMQFTQIFHKKHLQRAVILPTIIVCVTMVLAKLINCVLFGIDFMLRSISIAQFIIILWALVAEEIGWRGYLEPLLKRCGVHRWINPCIVGMIWCLWHYHFFLQSGITVPIPLFCISCIIESYIYSFLMSVTENNIVSAMTYHFMWNLLIRIVAINPIDNSGNIFSYLILVILEGLVLFVFRSIGKVKTT